LQYRLSRPIFYQTFFVLASRWCFIPEIRKKILFFSHIAFFFSLCLRKNQLWFFPCLILAYDILIRNSVGKIKIQRLWAGFFFDCMFLSRYLIYLSFLTKTTNRFARASQPWCRIFLFPIWHGFIFPFTVNTLPAFIHAHRWKLFQWSSRWVVLMIVDFFLPYKAARSEWIFLGVVFLILLCAGFQTLFPLINPNGASVYVFTRR